MTYQEMAGRRRCAALVGILTLVACTLVASTGRAGDETTPFGLARWAFIIGEWNLVETRYDFDGKLIETNTGRVRFSYVMKGQRIEELQELTRGREETTALQLFVHDPGSEKIEIARTDSGHYGFWVIIGTMRDDRMNLVEKHPDPTSEVTRRITYQRIDSDHFLRKLEFSTDKGQSWFVRSEWRYARSYAGL